MFYYFLLLFFPVLVEDIVHCINKSIDMGTVEETHTLIQKQEGMFPKVLTRSAFLYHDGLYKAKQQSLQVSLKWMVSTLYLISSFEYFLLSSCFLSAYALSFSSLWDQKTKSANLMFYWHYDAIWIIKLSNQVLYLFLLINFKFNKWALITYKMFSTIVFLMIVMALKLYNHGTNSILFLFISVQESNEVCLSHQAICDQLSGTFIVSFKLPGPLGNFTNG